MSIIALVLFIANVHHASALSIQQSVLCARYLDDRELAGPHIMPIEAQMHIDATLAKLTANVAQSRAELPHAGPWRRLQAYVGSLREQSQRFTTQDVGAPTPERGEVYRRQRVAQGLTELRDMILTSADDVTPVRRLTKGRDKIIAYLTGLKQRATEDQAKLDAEYDVKLADLAAEKVALRAQRDAMFTEMRERIDAEAKQSWSRKYFGPNSRLSQPERLGLLVGYIKKSLGVSVLTGLLIPGSFPITMAALSLGWFGTQQWIYLGAEHAKVFVSGWWRERKVGKIMTQVDRYRRDVARADHQIADLDTLIALVERTDAPNAAAALTYDVAVSMDRKTPEFKESLRGEILRRAALKASPRRRGQRTARIHHVLSFGEDGEPVLATNLIDATVIPVGAREWASTLVMSLFTR